MVGSVEKRPPPSSERSPQHHDALGPTSARWLGTAAIGVLFVSAAALSLAPLLSHEGWPVNHENLAWRFRTLVYADHFAQGDFLPVWSSEDFFGLGTPLPFFYHKLFYILSGLLYLACGSVKASVTASLAVFLVLGSAGLHRTLLRLRVARTAAALLAAALPLQSYTIFDWLVRGAMADLSASMIAPWVLYSLVVALQERRIPWHLPTSLVLLALAHSVLGFAIGLFALAAGLAIWTRLPRREKLRELRRLFLAVLVCALLFAPWALAFARLWGTYDISAAVPASYEPARNFRLLSETYALSWEWTPDTFSVWGARISPETLVALVATVLALAVAALRRGRALFREEPALGFLLSGLFVCFLLQLPVAAPFYALVPGLRFIQFPFRWLSLEQVLALGVIGWGLARLSASRGPRIAGLAAAVLLAVAALGSRAYDPGPVHWYPADFVESIPPAGRDPGFPGVGEYLPILRYPGETEEERRRVLRKSRHARAPFWTSREEAVFASETARERCQLEATPRLRREPLALHYRVNCPLEATLVVRHHYSGLERAWVKRAAGWRRSHTHRTPEDPRLRIDLPAGESQVRVDLPRLWHALAP